MNTHISLSLSVALTPSTLSDICSFGLSLPRTVSCVFAQYMHTGEVFIAVSAVLSVTKISLLTLARNTCKARIYSTNTNASLTI